ncbi:hypothetical protein M885DRAFT_512693 [Pelagophyceae sp. CCMP2097]|nr:hypothetical protein M885DRAFT_512693 [Pelagophyceae sp. CCMP2097]
MDQVNSFFNQVKTGATAAANSAQIAAEKAKLQAEISLLRNKVKTTKKDMGLVVYDALAIGDSDETQRVFNRFKLTVDGFESQIAEKMGRIEALDYQQR